MIYPALLYAVAFIPIIYPLFIRKVVDCETKCQMAYLVVVAAASNWGEKGRTLEVLFGEKNASPLFPIISHHLSRYKPSDY